MKPIRRHLNYANVVATLALLFAMSGGALAANHFLINSTKQINPKVLKKLKGSPGPKGAGGAQGVAGPRGSAGLQGPAGTPDTSNFFTKTESDGRYLGKGAQAVDSAELGGVAASQYTTGAGTQGSRWQELGDKGIEPNFLSIPGIGLLGVSCTVTPTPSTTIGLGEGQGSTFVMWNNIPNKAAPTQANTILSSGNHELKQTFSPAEIGSGQASIQAANQVGTPAATIATITVSAAVTEGVCWFQANYVTSHPGA
jgi:hypothetical protein